MIFWIAAAGVAAIAILWLIRPLVLSRGGAAPPAAENDLQVFRDQLRAVDRDLERGVLEPSEAEGAKAEISRRLLAAAAEAERRAPAAPAPKAASRALAAALALVLLAGGGAIYLQLGAPGMPDRPLAERLAERERERMNRPSQAEAERAMAERRAEQAGMPEAPADPEAERLEQLVAQLRGIVEGRPQDVEGRRILASALMRLNEMAEARRVMQRAIELQADAAPAEDYATLAEAMVLAAGGYVSPQAQQALASALRRDETHPIARYYAGLALAQDGRYAQALSFWRGLLEEGPEDAPWIGAIRAQIGALAEAAGEREGAPAPAPPAGGAPGPDAADMEAARDMSPEDRRAMIEGMVGRLQDRLAEQGGTPEEWARLIGALAVMGREAEAAKAWADAQAAIEDPEALAPVRAAAREAGLETAE